MIASDFFPCVPVGIRSRKTEPGSLVKTTGALRWILTTRKRFGRLLRGTKAES